MLSQIQTDRVAYQAMLDRLPFALRARVEAKLEAEENAFIAALTDFVPSMEPQYWAKSSCKHCHGVGTSGKNCTTGNIIPCKCSQKRFVLWLRDFRIWYNALKQNGEVNA